MHLLKFLSQLFHQELETVPPYLQIVNQLTLPGTSSHICSLVEAFLAY